MLNNCLSEEEKTVSPDEDHGRQQPELLPFILLNTDFQKTIVFIFSFWNELPLCKAYRPSKKKNTSADQTWTQISYGGQEIFSTETLERNSCQQVFSHS